MVLPKIFEHNHTLADYNLSVRLACAIVTGKEFRRMRRKNKKNK